MTNLSKQDAALVVFNAARESHGLAPVPQVPQQGLHETGWDGTLTPERQFELDWSGYARWAIPPLMSRETFRAQWDQTHAACVDCASFRTVVAS